jgi:hypothetical protein
MNNVNKYFSKIPQSHVFLDAVVTEYDILQEYCYEVGVRIDCVEVSLHYNFHHTFIHIFVVTHFSTMLRLALFCPTSYVIGSHHVHED